MDAVVVAYLGQIQRARRRAEQWGAESPLAARRTSATGGIQSNQSKPLGSEWQAAVQNAAQTVGTAQACRAVAAWV